MKGLSLIEPWSSLVARGLKRVETRSWQTPYRGMIAIHASKSKDVIKNLEEVRWLFEQAGISMPADWPQKAEDYPLGKIIAIVRLADCKKMDEKLIAQQTNQEIGFGAWARGRAAWFLADIVKLEVPVPCKGALSLWDVPKDVEAMIVVKK